MTGPLSGLRVLNTRPIHQAQTLTRVLEALGAEVVACPVLEISALPADWMQTMDAIMEMLRDGAARLLSMNGSSPLSVNGSSSLSTNGCNPLSTNGSSSLSMNGSSLRSIHGSNAHPQQGQSHENAVAIFTSSNAVLHFFNQFPAEQWPRTLCTLSVGKATQAALLEKNIPSLTPLNESSSEGLLALPCLQQPAGKRILIIKGKGGRPLLATSLTQAKAEVVELAVYERKLPDVSSEALEEIWRNDRIDIILITSEQAMKQLFVLFGKKAEAWLRAKPYLLISQRLAQAASCLGLTSVFITTPENVVEKLIELRQQFNSRRRNIP